MAAVKRPAHFRFDPANEYGTWRWTLVDTNGRELAVSAGLYPSLALARRAARRVERAARAAAIAEANEP